MAKAPLFAVLLFLTAVPSVEAAGYRLECPSRDVDRAIRGCTIAIGTAGANLPVAYANRCVAFWLKGAYARAAEDCEQALQHGGTFAVAHFIRGIDLADKGDQPAAIAEYSRSIELTPTGSAYFNRGTAYLALGDRVRAITDFDKAIAAQPSPPQAHLNRGIALLGSGRTDEITAEFDRGVELLHGEPFASSIRAEALQVLNLEHGGYGSSHPVRSFPPSKVLPEVLAIELFSSVTLRASAMPNAAPSMALSPSPQAIPAQPRVRNPAVAPAPPAASRDSLAECLRLWHPETQTTQLQWHQICRSLEFRSPNSGRKR